MGRRTIPLYGFLALALVAAACGGGGDNGAFEDCGNGVLDGGEVCDDGNLIDEDSCLSTCEPNVCGDGFLLVGVESCDLLPTSSVTCASLGFADGTVECTSDCTFDTSGCTGTSAPTATPTPTPDVTPSGGDETATPTPGESPGTPTPTATSTPGGGGPTCESGDTVVVAAALDKAFAAFAMTLAYPTDAVNLPGSGQNLAARVVFDVSGGLSTASDDDDIGGDGVDDTLHASFVSNVANDPGNVFTVTFDCVPGQPRPVAGAFICTVASASTPDAETIPDEICTVTVQ